VVSYERGTPVRDRQADRIVLGDLRLGGDGLGVEVDRVLANSEPHTPKQASMVNVIGDVIVAAGGQPSTLNPTPRTLNPEP